MWVATFGSTHSRNVLRSAFLEVEEYSSQGLQYGFTARAKGWVKKSDMRHQGYPRFKWLNISMAFLENDLQNPLDKV